jgi:signal transduction histidine kinase
MQDPTPIGLGAEFADAVFQALITTGLALFAVVLYRRIRERWLAWWAAAWTLYVVRLVAIITFLATGDLIWLFWHQVVTGWVALTILWAALVFSRNLPWRNRYLWLAAFPLLLGWVAVNGLDQFLLVAIPMVALIAGATLWTGWVFWRHAQRTGSTGARFVAIAFALWGLHHLDYPFLRARGAWQPWGYFLDITFELAVGVGFGLMVLSDLAARLSARTAELARLQDRRVAQDESTRRRLARELHDESAQTFSAVRLELGLLRESADHTTRERLDRAVALVDDGIRGVRRVINDLRPALLDDLGLPAAVRALGEDVTTRGGPQVHLDVAEALPPLPVEAELALFRAAQESLANALRHARASTIHLSLRPTDSGLRLIVRDDGQGLPAGADLASLERDGHLGLVGMRERITALGGTMTVRSDSGVTVIVDVTGDGRQATGGNP